MPIFCIIFVPTKSINYITMRNIKHVKVMLSLQMIDLYALKSKVLELYPDPNDKIRKSLLYLITEIISQSCIVYKYLLKL